MNNFLTFPVKRTEPLGPLYGDKIKLYIKSHFNDTHPDAFAQDVSKLTTLRKSWCEGAKGPDVHKETVKQLLLYQAQLAFLLTKFPSDISLTISYHLPYPLPYTFNPDPLVSLPSLTFERAAVIYNVAAVYAGLGAAENRSEAEGIKRALTYLQQAAGALSYLQTAVLPTLIRESSTAPGANPSAPQGQDLTASFLSTMENFCLAQAQECFWQRAVLEKYKNGVVAKLAMKVSEYYDAAIQASKEGAAPAADYLPSVWTSHMTVKKLHFEAAAQYRMSQEDLEKARYGDEIGRMRHAETLAKQALASVKSGMSDAVVSDLKSLQAILASSLKRAVRDNDVVYVQAVPPPTQLTKIVPAAMVKAAIPREMQESLDWLLKEGGGALFSGLVPYGVHLALSIYDDRKDTLVRTALQDKSDELDGITASTLQSLGLPGSLTAMERPAGLPPALMDKAEEVQRQGGPARVQQLLSEVSKARQTNAALLDQSLDILDQEATDSEQALADRPDIQIHWQPSHEANRHLTDQAAQYRSTLNQAQRSDETVNAKWQEWARLVGVLAGGEESLQSYIPSSTRNASSQTDLPASARTLRASLEELDDGRGYRQRLVAEAKRMAERDDIRPSVLQEAARLAHGGSGDVKPEWFEESFDKELRKYQRLVEEMETHYEKQTRLLNSIRDQNDAFLKERQTDSRVKTREQKLQDMDLCYWKWKEVISNCEEGLKFYKGLNDLLHQYKDSVQGWVYGRRNDIARALDQRSRPASPPPPARAPAVLNLPHPNSGAWQSAMDFLPPPPPARSSSNGGPAYASPAPAPVTSSPAPSGRVTRSAASQQTPSGSPAPKPPRKKGGAVV